MSSVLVCSLLTSTETSEANRGLKGSNLQTNSDKDNLEVVFVVVMENAFHCQLVY